MKDSELHKLKSRAYDIIKQKQMIDSQLAQINQLIGQEELRRRNEKAKSK